MTDEELFALLSRAEEMNFENWKTYRVLYNAELGKLQDRVKALEAALLSYYRYVCPTCGGRRCVVQSCPENLARAALGEKKDD